MGFSFLKRYEAQKAYYDAYKAWDALNPQQKQQRFALITDETKRCKPERGNGFIAPFNTQGTSLQYIIMPVLHPTQTGEGTDVAQSLASMLATYYIDPTEAAPASGGIEYPRFKAARLALTHKDSFVKKASRITTREYMKPDVNTVSAPFGRSSASQDYSDAAAAITTAANAWKNAVTGTQKRSFKFTPEGAKR